MRPRFGFKKLAVATVVATTVGVASTIALTSEPAAASPVFGYSGYAHGTYVQTGLANSGPQVASFFGCTTRTGVKSQNDLATATVNKLALARSVRTHTSTHNDARGNGVTSTGTAVDIRLGSLLTLRGVTTTARAVHKNGKFERSGGTRFLAVKIGDLSIPSLLQPAPNTKVAVPGLGHLILNRVGGATTSTGGYSFAQAVVIHSTIRNKYLPKGVTVVVLMTKAEVGGPATAILRGDTYGTQARVGGLVKSDATSRQSTCFGTGGKTRRVDVAQVKVPGLADVGAITTTMNGVIGPERSAVRYTSKVAGVTVGSGSTKLVIGAITSSASATKTKDGKVDLRSNAKVLSISVGGKSYSVPSRPNQTLKIAGIAELTFNKVVRQERYISVDALQIKVEGLRTVVILGHSAAGVIG